MCCFKRQVLCAYVMAVNLVLSWDAEELGAGVSLTLLPAPKTLYSCWILLPTLDIRAFATSYCILFCPVWLLSPGDLLFSEEETGCMFGGRDLKRKREKVERRCWDKWR